MMFSPQLQFVMSYIIHTNSIKINMSKYNVIVIVVTVCVTLHNAYAPENFSNLSPTSATTAVPENELFDDSTIIEHDETTLDCENTALQNLEKDKPIRIGYDLLWCVENIAKFFNIEPLHELSINSTTIKHDVTKLKCAKNAIKYLKKDEGIIENRSNDYYKLLEFGLSSEKIKKRSDFCVKNNQYIIDAGIKRFCRLICMNQLKKFSDTSKEALVYALYKVDLSDFTKMPYGRAYMNHIENEVEAKSGYNEPYKYCVREIELFRNHGHPEIMEVD